MNHHDDHADVIHGFYAEQKQVFDSSDQGMYAFLDNDNRVCNGKFATMLGYATAKEWSSVNVQESFPDAFVAQKSQQDLVDTYQNAMENGVGSTFDVTWKKKSGGSVDTTVILVPVMYQGHTLALHFISEK